MWFDDEDLFGRRRAPASRRRRSTLNAATKRKKRRPKKSGARGRGIRILVIVPLIVGGACLVAWGGLLLLRHTLFTGNERFKIEHLDIVTKDGAVITPARVREYTGIRAGLNLFDVDVRKIRSDFLAHAPNVRSMEIRRVLPDTLRVEIVERVPLARLGNWGSSVVDSEGCVFRVRGGAGELPAIVGLRGLGLKPGSRLEGMALAAVQALDACHDPGLRLKVSGIDVSVAERLIVYIAGRKVVKLAWPGMGEHGSEPRRRLLARLSRLSQAVHSDEGQLHMRFDATYEDIVVGQ